MPRVYYSKKHRRPKEICDYCYYNRLTVVLTPKHINAWLELNVGTDAQCICSTDLPCLDETCLYYDIEIDIIQGNPNSRAVKIHLLGDNPLGQAYCGYQGRVGISEDMEQVTCQRCLNYLAKKAS